ncbi:MAG: aldo/keto reductase [Candidatus Dormiibacterota bacterium]
MRWGRATVRTVKLPQVGVETTVVGFGCAGLFRLPRRADRRAVLEAAYDAGIRHFDVAPMYGLGMAESELAPVLKGRRAEITVTTKFGIGMTVAGRLAGRVQGPARALLATQPSLGEELKARGRGPRSGWVGRMLYSPEGYSVRSAERSLAHSLRALQTDYIDVFTLHDPVGHLAGGAPDLLAYLNRQRDAGRIRAWGITGEIRDLLEVARELQEPAPLIQFRDDVFEPLPTTDAGLAEARITFGGMSRVLPAMRRFLANHPDECNKWSERLTMNLREKAVLPTLLLRQALRRNPGGVALFTSTSSGRVRSAAESVSDAAAVMDPNESLATSGLADATRAQTAEPFGSS